MATPFDQLQRPGTNAPYQAAAQKARDLAITRAVGAAPAGAPPPTQAAQGDVAGQATLKAGQDVLAQTGQAVQAARAQGQLAAGAQQETGQAALGARALQQKSEGLALEDALAKQGQDVKQELFDRRVSFETEQVGQGALQTSQLLDWAASKARGSEEQKTMQQSLEQASQRELMVLQHGATALENTLTAEANGRIQKKSHQERLAMEQALSGIKQKLAKAEAKKAGQAAMIQGIFTTAGAVVGGVYGGPEGAMAGSAIGAGAGGVVAGAAT